MDHLDAADDVPVELLQFLGRYPQFAWDIARSPRSYGWAPTVTAPLTVVDFRA
ncbi:hypothetical protein [Kitasatospora sp. NPDC051914]|uniref:hypothetical protein n=1 Tax=Kitasatospora sp. NPDC051914 TaxID=3154945 RepID=UPI003412861A